MSQESSKDFNLLYTSFQVDKEKGLKIQLAPSVCPFLFGKCESIFSSENSVYITTWEKKKNSECKKFAPHGEKILCIGEGPEASILLNETLVMLLYGECFIYKMLGLFCNVLSRYSVKFGEVQYM
jgi:hypothetical protein